MDIPLPGYLYFDKELYGGHFFIVGPDDPWDPDNVLIFCCTSQAHSRPNIHGCHVTHHLPSFHLEQETVSALPKPTWVRLDEAYNYKKTDFETKWKYAREKLPIELAIDILRCAALSDLLAAIDIDACRKEAELLINTL